MWLRKVLELLFIKQQNRNLQTKQYKENGDCKLKGIIKNVNQQQNSLNSINWTIFIRNLPTEGMNSCDFDAGSGSVT